MFTVPRKSSGKSPPYRGKFEVNGLEITMEIDTGASLSVISEETYQYLSQRKEDLELKESKVTLHTYTGEPIKPKGLIEVSVEYDNETNRLPLLVLSGKGPNLVGRNWLETIRLDWKGIRHLARPSLENILSQYEHLFKEELGTLKGTKAKNYADPSTKPVFCRARSVPYTMRSKVEKELERLETEGTIEAVQYSEWTTPMVPILKPGGSVRLCGDYKVTVNKASRLDAYPIPKIEELHNKLAGGKTFTELDLSHAYEQMVLDEDSRKLVTINTHRGLYRYNRSAIITF